uniref:Uncharacterized protein n=1 Tax=Rhipicephalus zambeziensis TaxID=60191 RepID=A0A224Y6X8_9ACAR
MFQNSNLVVQREQKQCCQKWYTLFPQIQLCRDVGTCFYPKYSCRQLEPQSKTAAFFCSKYSSVTQNFRDAGTYFCTKYNDQQPVVFKATQMPAFATKTAVSALQLSADTSAFFFS